MLTSCAVDVGLRHMSVCVVTWRSPAPRNARELAQRASEATIVYWEVSPLSAETRRGTACVLEDVLVYVEARGEIFSRCDAIAIEQQRTSLFRAISVALYVRLRAVAPGARVAFQSASAKLAPWASPRSYGARKAEAVRLSAAILQGQPGALAHLLAAGKKDDLADAHLHALARSVVPARAPRRLDVLRQHEAREASVAVRYLHEKWEAGAEPKEDRAPLPHVGEESQVLD
jgi:hypothetical protein